MNDNKVSQAEAEKFLNMLKKSLVSSINFPETGTSIEFKVQGDTDRDIFIIKILRGKKNRLKYELGARISFNNILLLELHINAGNTHVNPDGTKLKGSHWHIYTEQYGRALAYPADDINSTKFVENTIDFLKKFNVIKCPEICYQMELL